MRRPWLYPLLILLNMVWATRAFADDEWGVLSGRLSPRMTEQQVMNAIGYRPNKVELKTCGTDSPGGAWQCKIYTFGGLYYHLTVYFQQDDTDQFWRVNSWTVYP